MAAGCDCLATLCLAIRGVPCTLGGGVPRVELLGLGSGNDSSSEDAARCIKLLLLLGVGLVSAAKNGFEGLSGMG